jgi:hypothetical protein
MARRGGQFLEALENRCLRFTDPLRQFFYIRFTQGVLLEASPAVRF